jgi:hypothetical protein
MKSWWALDVSRSVGLSGTAYGFWAVKTVTIPQLFQSVHFLVLNRPILTPLQTEADKGAITSGHQLLLVANIEFLLFSVYIL